MEGRGGERERESTMMIWEWLGCGEEEQVTRFCCVQRDRNNIGEGRGFILYSLYRLELEGFNSLLSVYLTLPLFLLLLHFLLADAP